jgi:fluoride exporter
MAKLILIFLGSGLGGIMRYGLSSWVQGWSAQSFPAGTLMVNIIGCFGIGFLATAFAANAPPLVMREEYRIAIIIGILGGFTTFSAFGAETFALIAHKQVSLAVLNVAVSVIAGLGAVWMGTWLAQRTYGA